MTIEDQLMELRRVAWANLVASVELGTGLADGFCFFQSPLGEVMVAFNPLGVSAVDLANNGFEARFESLFGRRLVEATPPAGWDGLIRRALERGQPGTLPVDLRSVTPFRRGVLEQAATIPRGQIRSYAWLADKAGRPKAVRAVGSTMSHNPLPLIIPCHRVIRTDGRIGNYSLGGAANKVVLLKSEGVDVEGREI
jgi:O-6-methylguanine DNA methyltransferase